MAKIIDITEKLNFDKNPTLVIKEKELEVNADAPTMLKIMGIMGKSGVEIEQIGEAYELVFPEKSRNEIDKMKLSVRDWMIVVQEAMGLILGDDTPQGE